MDNILYYLLALLPLLFLITISKASLGARRHRHGLHLPPGPWRLPGIGSLHHLRGELPHRALRDLSLRYGPLMFLKFGEIPVVVASTPDAAKEILKTRDAVFSTRPLSLTMKVITKNGAGVVWAPYGEHWRQLRKICMMELLSAKRVQSFRHIREEEAARLAMAVSAATTPLVNLSKLLAIYVADASVHAILGSRFKDRDTLLRYVDEAVKLAGGSTLVDLFPSSRIARALSRRALRKAEVYRETVFAFMDGVVREHLERRSLREEARQEDLIDVLLRIRGEGNLQFPLTMHIIEAVIFVSLRYASQKIYMLLHFLSSSYEHYFWDMTQLYVL
jgi:cytochrome P450